MGIDNSAVVIVGLSVDELGLSEDEVWDLVNDGLDWASPYFDAPWEECVLGYTLVETYSFSELKYEHDELELRKQFTDRFGKEPRTWLALHIT